MSNVKLTKRVTVEREITGIIRDLVLFAREVEKAAGSDLGMTNDDLVELADEYWDREHGE